MTFGPGFAFLDVETTGLSPVSDRVVEIGIVRTDVAGNVVARLSSLVNPGVPVESLEIHQISQEDVDAAPRFAAIAGHVVHLLAGAAVVGHNAPFHLAFVATELVRMGHEAPPIESICTFALMRRLRGAGRGLSACCELFGIERTVVNHAPSDAEAVRELFWALARESGPQPRSTFRGELERAATVAWPSIASTAEPAPRTEARDSEAHRETTPAIARLVRARSTAVADDPKAEAYLAVLDEVLEDRVLTADESRRMQELVSALGIANEDITHIHFRYLRELAAAALADGVVTSAERADMEQVAPLLGFPAAAVEAALSEARRWEDGESVSDDTRIVGPVASRDRQAADAALDVPLSDEEERSKLQAEQCGRWAPVRLEAAVAAGWYADPSGAPSWRYWDGAAWTDHVAPL